jgi:3-O-methylgallate 3,4-dioxygenase
MAEIVLGIGTSHSPMLNSPAEDYPKHAKRDSANRQLLDRNGQPRSYGELLEAADPSIKDQIRPDVLEERATRCSSNIDRLAKDLATSRLDALIVIGDDQNEQYSDDNLPAMLIYWGQTIVNTPLSLGEDAEEYWRRARAQYHEVSETRDYPVQADLAKHMIEALIDRGFDISAAKRLAKPRGEGHAFGFVHRRLMGEPAVPIVPVALNTYYPPNQPRPARCYQLGQAIRDAVHAWDGAARVGIVGSGGLSHFTVDEELDRLVLDACRNKDGKALSAIPPNKLNSGSSEIRNWITVAGAAEHLDTRWQDYVPCYRSAAGTGCGMGFSVWG